MTTAETNLKDTITALYAGWLKALEERKFEWFDRHLAEDYTLTAHPFEKLFLRKREFIEVDKLVTQAKVHIEDVFAHRAGPNVVSHLIARIEKEAFAADPGHDMPSAAALAKLLTGKSVVYASAWRQESGIWKCFDHHMIGPID
jgi:hypothetical protein